MACNCHRADMDCKKCHKGHSQVGFYTDTAIDAGITMDEIIKAGELILSGGEEINHDPDYH